ncbi:hypothetical protein SEA_RIPARIAN_55 [Mycobacterium phage Riparian]|uniref:Uncharacterized protein n=1 Tax=Mycobacterium phage Riparian TaxID=2341079 RepID=A0A3G3LWY1_9CAUD|nr:hypothetical protein SEA_RIPARIAN_55 [Mycobacterium phage Riparian]
MQTQRCVMQIQRANRGGLLAMPLLQLVLLCRRGRTGLTLSVDEHLLQPIPVSLYGLQHWTMTHCNGKPDWKAPTFKPSAGAG